MTDERGPGPDSEATPQPAQAPDALPRPSTLFVDYRAPFLALLAFGALLAVLAAVAPDVLLRVDAPLARAIRGQGLLREEFHLVTRAGSQRLTMLAALALALLVRRRCLALAASLPLALLIGIVVDVGLKLLVARERPGDPLIGTSLGSFPSGHALTAAVFFGTLPPIAYVLTRRRFVFSATAVVSSLAVAAVALSRVYLGAHWPSDVLASLILGAAILLLAELVVFTRLGLSCACPLHAALPEAELPPAPPS